MQSMNLNEDRAVMTQSITNPTLLELVIQLLSIWVFFFLIYNAIIPSRFALFTMPVFLVCNYYLIIKSVASLFRAPQNVEIEAAKGLEDRILVTSNYLFKLIKRDERKLSDLVGIRSIEVYHKKNDPETLQGYDIVLQF